ncbi:hypothetical protein Ddye_027950 [Dipteronia dyeriana]|uniref:Leucine-rich repeat-containing N-terminal plant-type domain-containing protein n=1 Tax=Dipteronia dyeriana TaxID=168575 RepID=A0AAD9WRX4_9ROSI|nr:hypothetical protein Ddye_027950 [Dipteronia dyeriana]
MENSKVCIEMGLKQQAWMWVFVLVLIINASFQSGWSEGCLEQERFALLQLKPFFNHPHTLSNWVEGDHNNSDCCQWERVECSNDTTGRVISLDLFYTRGEEMGEWYLNASLFSPFQQLQRLYLDANSIAGCVENEDLRSSNLKYLDLSGNIFNKNILSSLSALSSLKSLYINDIGLNGSVDLSEMFHSLRNLEVLEIGNNQIHKLVVTTGNGVSSSNLRDLILRNVSIHDGRTLFQSLESFPYLKTVHLEYNNFSGILISNRELHNFTNLKELYMGGSSVHISLLQSIAAFTSLETLNMRDCQLNGILDIKGGLCELVHLRELDLSRNNLKGALPSCFGNLTSLEELDISFNQFSGNISLSPLMALISIQQLKLSYNDFQIPISLEPFSNHSKLKSFSCKNNDLYVEAELYSLAPKFQLNSIRMSGCKGSCTFPKFLYYQHDLLAVDLSHNNFTGVFPGYYEGAVDETFYPLMRTEEIVEFRTKTISYFYHGNILTKMFGIDLSCNKLTGDIPPQIGNLTMIHALNLSHNNLYGSIPSTFSNLKQIESLDLSYNNLSGKIPHQLAELYTLEVFSVAYNNLSGRTLGLVAQFSTFNASSYDGNPLLCGLPLPRSCDAIESPTLLPTDSDGIGEENDFMDMGIFYISFTVSYAIVILTIVVVLFINPYWRQTWFHLVETWMTLCYYFIVDHLPSVI